MKVRFYHIFSYWIFFISILLPKFKLSIFPLHLIAAPFGLFYLIKSYKTEPLVKLLIAGVIHAAPLVWTAWNFNKFTIGLSLGLTLLYLGLMTVLGVDIILVYKTMLNEHHNNLQSYIDERFA